MPIAASFASTLPQRANMCPSWETCCAWRGQEHLLPCLPHPAQLRPSPGLLLEALDLGAVGLPQRPGDLLCTHRRGWPPAHVGQGRGCPAPVGAILAESARRALRLPWAPASAPPPPSLFPKDTSWPLIRGSYALLTVNIAFVPLMGVCCCKAGAC